MQIPSPPIEQTRQNGMALSKIDCWFFGSRAADEGSYVAVNPRQRPGSLVIAGSLAEGESIGGKVACKMALEHFVSGALQYFGALEGSSDQEDKAPSIVALERAFRDANSAVYQFGHKLAAGGRLAASLLGVVIDSRLVAVGRVGSGSCYLARSGEMFPFFESTLRKSSDLSPEKGGSDVFLEERGVGSKSVITVELASVPLQAGDQIYIFSHALDSGDEHALLDIARLGPLESGAEMQEFFAAVCGDANSVAYAGVCRVGPEAVYLDTVRAQSKN